jgi:carbamoyl-phosphate synthase large subunit
LREEGIRAITVNCNPETVSTDFDTSDRLYFEPLVPEDVLNILEKERPEGVIVQFGGQTAINLAGPVAGAGFRILGPPVRSIDLAEDREKFDAFLAELDIPRPPGGAAMSLDGAIAAADRVGFPVLVRPSYVLGGRAMGIVHDRAELREYVTTAMRVSPDHPVLIDKYLAGLELEVDAIADGETVLIPGIMEHVERAGVHSGDSIAVCPPRSLDHETQSRVVDYTCRIARALGVRGIVNIQYVLKDGVIYVIEVNPRSSRTVPYLSKITGVPMVNLATKVSLGRTLREMGYQGGLWPEPKYIAVKAPVFSFAKLSNVDVSLGPEMKSTGEVMGVAEDYPTALYKAIVSAGYAPPDSGTVLVSVTDRDKQEAVPLIGRLAQLGYDIVATQGTQRALKEAGINAGFAVKIHEGSPNALDLIRSNQVHLVINTFTRGGDPGRDGFRIRRAAAEMGVPCVTSLDTAAAVIQALEARVAGRDYALVPVQDYAKQRP